MSKVEGKSATINDLSELQKYCGSIHIFTDTTLEPDTPLIMTTNFVTKANISF